MTTLKALQETFNLTDLLTNADRQGCFCFTQNNYNRAYPYDGFKNRLAVGTSAVCAGNLSDFEKFLEKYSGQHLFGYFGYDLKNDIEPHLESNLPPTCPWPNLYFFVPESVIEFPDGVSTITNSSFSEYKKISESSIAVRPRMAYSDYREKAEAVKKHIEEGDVYELNLCMEFFAENVSLDPVALYLKLSRESPVPFSSLLKIEQDRYIICASPERFLKKTGQKLITQPMKGTIRRGNSEEEDNYLRKILFNDEKERAENMMIVDLSRNDLAKNSVPGSVTVEELFSIYPFRYVHQMISTVTSEALPDRNTGTILHGVFPPGSMTGAPKIRAMELIEQYEQVKRGPYSGALGYFEPNGDFDLNVIIRTIFYDRSKKILSFQVGSAVTFDSDPAKEYEECLLKAEAMRRVIAEV